MLPLFSNVINEATKDGSAAEKLLGFLACMGIVALLVWASRAGRSREEKRLDGDEERPGS
jgi:hypothetical protein